ncbi:MAG: hypothetical protein KGP10_05065 [Actinomycetales bacterium]|nr:hypothetical protein [Actinomycetales bacterium]
MSASQPADTTGLPQRPVAPVLAILSTVGWLIVGLVGGVLAPFSFFLFDAGDVSGWTWTLFWGMWLTPVLCLLSIAAGWPLWALTRRRRSRSARAARIVVALLPLLGLGAIAVASVAIEVLCGGSLTCR